MARFSSFLRRHLRSVVAAGVVVAALIGFVLISSSRRSCSSTRR
jgi:hypothetical protein